MKPNKRKKKFIDFKTQSLIALEVMLHSLILPLLIYIFLAVDPFSTIFSSNSAETHYDAVRDLVNMNIAKVPIFVIILLFIGFLSIIFSHHIAGPAFRFVKALRAILEKDLTHTIVLRKWDYLQNVGTEFNIAISNLSSDLRTIQESSKKISDLTEDLNKSRGDLKKEIKDIVDNSKRIEEIVSTYKLG